jgi:hypothetical protein
VEWKRQYREGVDLTFATNDIRGKGYRKRKSTKLDYPTYRSVSRLGIQGIGRMMLSRKEVICDFVPDSAESKRKEHADGDILKYFS